MRWEEMPKAHTSVAELVKQFETHCQLEGKPETTSVCFPPRVLLHGASIDALGANMRAATRNHSAGKIEAQGDVVVLLGDSSCRRTIMADSARASPSSAR